MSTPTGRVVLELGDAQTNRSWVEVGGVLSIAVTRFAYCTPTSLSAAIAWNPDVDAVSGLKRIYPYLNVRVVERRFSDSVTNANDRQFFFGRLDLAELVEDDERGRYWKLTARCPLSVLQDNYIGVGRWVSASPIVDPSNTRQVRFTQSVGPFQVDPQIEHPYIANYVGNYRENLGGMDPGLISFFASRPGEYRRHIVWDLAMNCVPSYSDVNGTDQLYGIAGYNMTYAPNSKRVAVNWQNANRVAVLDAIRDLSHSDPWWFGSGAPSEVEGPDVANAPQGANAGFGGELISWQDTVATGGRTLIYYARGSQTSGMTLSWGEHPTAAAGSYEPIINYDFGRDGQDIYSRVRTQGKGEAVTGVDVTNQLSIALDDMENVWDPARGLFRIRRERAQRIEGAGGGWDRVTSTDERDLSENRIMRDLSISNLISGTTGLSNTKGGVSRGRVMTAGRPGDIFGTTAWPASKVSVHIPPLGITAGTTESTFVCEGWEWRWPEDVTVWSLARQKSSDLGLQLLGLVKGNNEALSALQTKAETEWFQAITTLGQLRQFISFRHDLGVEPSGYVLKVALWDEGTRNTLNGAPVPVNGTVTTVPSLYQDSRNGQAVGAAEGRMDRYEIGLWVSRWIAYSEAIANRGSGGWYKSDAPSTILKVIVYP